jgi:TRAP transporter 4TM/12TM fusion protein
VQAPLKAAELAEQYDPRRDLTGVWKLFANAIALAIAAFYLYTAAFGQFGPQYHRGVFVLGIVSLIFLMYPATRRSPRHRPTLLDFGFIALTVVAIGYWIVEYVPLVYRVGEYLPRDFWMGVVALAVCLEAGRRVTGWIIPIFGVVALAYGLFGPYLPGVLAHRGFTFKRLVEYIYLTPEGLFGVMASVLPTYVLLFLILGAFLRASGVGQFFLDLPMAVTGHTVGGPAKVSVVASGLMGSINGSVLANTVSTGSLTIPLMKRAGFKPHVAAAVEASASTGGQILPPLMGAGVFIMVELTGIPYAEIIKIAAIPAILFFLSIYVIVHAEARRTGIPALPKADMPSFRKVIVSRWYYLVPFAVLLTLLFQGYSPNYAAFYTLISVAVVSWFNRDARMGPVGIANACIDGVKDTLTVGSLLGAIGILIGVVTLTAAGLTFSHALIGLAGGNLALGLILVAIASLVLGTGLPITASYIIVAVLAAPALQEMGATLIAAHLAIFWLSQDSNITPPVCLGAFCAAGIAKANPWRTAWASFRFAKILYVMPFLFVFGNILLTGTLLENLAAIAFVTLGVIVFSSWTSGWFLGTFSWPVWWVLLPAMILLFWPTWPTRVVGLVLTVLVTGFQLLRARREALTPSTAPASVE